MAESKSLFDRMNAVDVSKKVEKKNGLSYLSWAWAWGEVKKICPTAQYKVYETEIGGLTTNYFTDGRTCWVKVSVTCDDLEHIEYLPIMDVRNRSIPYEQITSMDVNKAIQRAITKACARHGVGLYIYAGEDLPEELIETAPAEAPQPPKKPAKASAPKPAPKAPEKAAPAPQEEEEVKLPFDIPPEMNQTLCSVCGLPIESYDKYSAETIIRDTINKIGHPVCFPCLLQKKAKKAEGGNK